MANRFFFSYKYALNNHYDHTNNVPRRTVYLAKVTLHEKTTSDVAAVLIKGTFVVKKTEVRINQVSAYETNESVVFYVVCRIAALALHYKHWHYSSQDRRVLRVTFICLCQLFGNQVLSSRFKC